MGSAKPLGGWEQPENGQRSSELRGHFVGHFLSASAQLAANGDQGAKAKGDYMVAEMAKCQEKLGGKYLSAFPTTWWDRLEKGERVWAPFYTIHKIMAGMFDMYRLAGNKQALQVLEGMAAWADEWTAPKTEEHMQQILTIEFGGIAETLYNLAAATNNDRWAKVGDRFQKKSFINPLALAPRRAARAARQHAYPAGDRGRPPLRDLGRHAVPRRGRLLLLRGERPRAPT